MRATVHSSKPINLKQLDDECGGLGLCIGPDDRGETVVMAADNNPITQDALEEAVAAHVAGPTPEEAKAAAKASAIAKLAALGLTEDEAAALVGA